MRNALAIACFVLSGAAGLIHQVCWIRRASLAFGSTSFALSTVLATFFLGLAIGSFLFGRLSRRSIQPLRVYAMLELALCGLALASLHLFDVAESVYGMVYRSTEGAVELHALLRFCLVAFVLLPPAVLMGGTLPLFCRQYVTVRGRIARPVALLYALNTLGAVAGCILTGLYLLPAWGIAASIRLGAVLNFVAGATVALLPGGRIPERASGAIESASVSPIRGDLLTIVFLGGAVGLGYEVLWSRFFSLVVRNTVYTYTLTLGTFLAGIVFGSLLASVLFDRRLPRGIVFGVMQMSLGLVVLVLMLMPPPFWNRFQADVAIYAALLLPAAALAGASFPLAVRLAVDDPLAAAPAVGRIAAVNTLGGIAGALGTGFVALSWGGLQASTIGLTGLSVAAGVLALVRLETGRVWMRCALASAGILAWLFVPSVTGTRLPHAFLATGGTLVDVREGLESNVAVLRRGSSLMLEIDRWWQGQDRATHQVMAAHLPMLLHSTARRVLVIGLGAGQTPARFLRHPIERLDVVDIEPAVFELVRRHFRGAWMDDTRVTLLREDGRTYLAHATPRYDVISLEVGQIFRPGAASFYTAEFYGRARERLAPGGMLCQFMPLPFFSVETFRSAVATFVASFPQSVLWYNTSELLLVGVNADELRVGVRGLEAALAEPRFAEDLRFAHWGGSRYWLDRPEVILGGFLAGPRGLSRLAEGASVLREDRPILEYSAAGASEAEANELPTVDLLRHHLDSVDTLLDRSLAHERVVEIEHVQRRNLDDIAASALARRAEALRTMSPAADVSALLAEAASVNPENMRVQRLLADALVLAGRFEEAGASYERALALDPADVLAHRGLGVVLHRRGQLEEAAGHYRMALESDPLDAETHNNLGAALGSRGDYSGALQHFEQAVALRPGYEDARRNLDRLRAHLGNASAP